MNCIEVTSVSEAMKKLPSSVVPINGLRRDNEGNLTSDALRTIVDGLKSRGIDPTDTVIHDKLQQDLGSFLCSLNNQYSVLLKELFRLATSKQPISDEFIEIIKDKNITMQDVINVSRHLNGIRVSDGTGAFIEGWQNTESTGNTKTDTEGMITQLKEEFTTLLSGDHSKLETQKQMVIMSEQKNKYAHNYLGLYGFLNLIAIGLMIYIAAAPNK
jgi:hypothetical protein